MFNYLGEEVWYDGMSNLNWVYSAINLNKVKYLATQQHKTQNSVD